MHQQYIWHISLFDAHTTTLQCISWASLEFGWAWIDYLPFSQVSLYLNPNKTSMQVQCAVNDNQWKTAIELDTAKAFIWKYINFIFC